VLVIAERRFPASMLKETSSAQNDDGVRKSLLQLEPSGALATSDLWDSDLRMEMATPRFKKSDLDNRRRKVSQIKGYIPMTSLMIRRVYQECHSALHRRTTVSHSF
jgi:hypothetical protein